MNSKLKLRKGFSLIELLAVIIILALIALIATPVITNILYKAKKGAFADSVRLAFGAIDNSVYVSNGKLDITKGIDVTDLQLRSQLIGGRFKSNQAGKIVANNVTDGHFCASGELTDLTITDDCALLDQTYVVNDTTPGNICGSNDETDYEGATTCYIYSVDDMVQFSNLVNSGKNFTNKTVILKTNLDFSSKVSYADKQLYNTIKDNFTPIGNATNKPFSGRFDGEGHTIRNITIRGNDYVGLFGNFTIEIKNFNIVNTNIEGNDYVGLVGKSSGVISGINVTNLNVKGRNFTGLIAGTSSMIRNINIISGTLTVTGTNVGGIAGESTSITSCLIHDMEVVAPNGSNIPLTAGHYTYLYGFIVEKATMSSGTIVENPGGNQKYIYTNDIKIGNTNLTGDLSNEYVNNISLYEYYIDTYIGGDNDNDGFYFDYDEEGELKVMSTANNPIDTTTIGSEFEKDGSGAYLIYDEDDFNKMSILSSNSSIKFKLMADLNFETKPYYAPNSGNMYGTSFAASFDGGFHTIKNVKIRGLDNTGLFGRVTGRISNFNVKNVQISGNDYVGLIGQTSGTIFGINVQSATINGNNYVGLIAGSGQSATSINIVKGNVTGRGTNIGGFTGYMRNTADDILIHNVTVTAPNNSTTSSITGPYIGQFYGIIEKANINVGNILGNENSYSKYLYTNDVKIGGVSQVGNMASEYINNMSLYDYYLDTYLGGDNDTNGFYFDHNASGEFVLRNTSVTPIDADSKLTKDGSGVYLIYTAEDFKEMSVLSTVITNRFKLMNDIDFAETQYYIPSSSNHSRQSAFNARFDGGYHTLKNINIKGYDNVGIFGKTIGTISNVKFENINIYGHNYVGLIGYSTGFAEGINIKNVTVSGNDYVGLLAGYVPAANSINVESGSVTGTGDYIGGITGARPNYLYSILIHNINVTAPNNSTTSAIISPGASRLSAIIEKANINVGSIVGTENSYSKYLYTNNVKIGGVNQTGNLISSDINNMSLYDYYIDTYLGGDNDTNNFYFDHNASGEFVLRNKLVTPIEADSKLTKDGSGAYLIEKPEDFKEMSVLSTVVTNRFKLANDIDFTDKQYYVPNSSYNINPTYFNSTFNGLGHTLRNIDLKGYDYTGLFGRVGGTIYNLNIEDTNITGNEYVGILAYGTNYSMIKGINVKDTTVNGSYVVGLIAGESDGNIETINIINGSVTGTNDYIGGVAGSGQYIKNILIRNVSETAPITSTHNALISPESSSYLTAIIENGTATNTTIAVPQYSSNNKYAMSTNVAIGTDDTVTVFDASNIGNMNYYSSLNIFNNIGIANKKNNCYFDNNRNALCSE